MSLAAVLWAQLCRAPPPHTRTLLLPCPQGNACKAVLSFVERESVDILVLGMFKERATKRRGLGLRGNASKLWHRSACPALVVPLTEAALEK